MALSLLDNSALRASSFITVPFDASPEAKNAPGDQVLI
jgi:hypothetical protein